MNRLSLFIILISYLINLALTANWAQVSGKISQNIAVTYHPAPDSPHWDPRYGMATVVVPPNNISGFSYLYILGGDTYDGLNENKNQVPGQENTRWESGYKNDVWQMSTTEWLMKGNIRLRTQYHQKIPQVQAVLSWTPITLGLHPPPGTTNDEWIQCTSFFRNQAGSGSSTNCQGNTNPQVQWSPRRNHAALYFNQYIWVLGGRAREFAVLPSEYAVGGILGPRVGNIPRTVGNEQQLFTTQRELSVLKSDVWRSLDGSNWELVTPGCKAPQPSLVAKGAVNGKWGTKQQACTKDSDCYGDESCDPVQKTCVCNMWSPREQHAVAAYGSYMYLSGGFASRLYSGFSDCGPYACGELDASAYRYYLSDVWRSSDGQIWESITETAFSVPNDPMFSIPLGRGAHQMLVIENKNKEPYLWVLGGQGGDNTVSGQPPVYFNDIWTSPISTGSPTTWKPILINTSSQSSTPFMPWEPRAGLGVALETGTPANQYVRTLFLNGGFNNDTVFEDTWAWRIDDPEDFWRKDFTPEAIFSTGDGANFHYANDSPIIYYVTPDSNVSMLQKYWVPTRLKPNIAKRLEERTYLPADKVSMLNSVGIYTIRDLADAGLYTILKLRGFDYPQVPQDQRLNFYDVCDYRALAIKVVDKCKLNVPNLYDGEKNMPWNNKPVFGGPPPAVDNVKWHGVSNYNYLLPMVDDPTVLTESWDGCTYIPQIQGLFGPNVNGIGYVSQVMNIRDPLPEVEELFCKQTPGPRMFHSLVLFEEKIFLLGGKSSTTSLFADAWYRDSRLPVATISKAPRSHTSDNWFYFVADKPGVFFEYRVWDPYNYQEIRPWTEVTHKTSIAWLNWRVGGPSNGNYVLYVRAVDPAGNRDETYLLGRNVYEWYYISPIPWDIIGGAVGGFIGLCIIAYMEYRRRVKKAAMERYAMKRMRRKFKAMQRDINGNAVDWRTLYMESKQKEEENVKDKKKKKKLRDKNAEKREKARLKREKEKELIKKKLRANKEKNKKVAAGDIEDAEFDPKTKAKVPSKYGKKTNKVGVIENEDDDMDFDRLIEEQKSGAVAKVGKTKSKSNKIAIVEEDMEDSDAKAKDKAKGLDQAYPKIESNRKEIAAGELKSSKGTESGTKQRKVNKRFKSYEEGGDAGGDNDDEEHKDDNGPVMDKKKQA